MFLVSGTEESASASITFPFVNFYISTLHNVFPTHAMKLVPTTTAGMSIDILDWEITGNTLFTDYLSQNQLPNLFCFTLCTQSCVDDVCPTPLQGVIVWYLSTTSNLYVPDDLPPNKFQNYFETYLNNTVSDTSATLTVGDFSGDVVLDALDLKGMSIVMGGTATSATLTLNNITTTGTIDVPQSSGISQLNLADTTFNGGTLAVNTEFSAVTIAQRQTLTLTGTGVSFFGTLTASNVNYFAGVGNNFSDLRTTLNLPSFAPVSLDSRSLSTSSLEMGRRTPEELVKETLDTIRSRKSMETKSLKRIVTRTSSRNIKTRDEPVVCPPLTYSGNGGASDGTPVTIPMGTITIPSGTFTCDNLGVLESSTGYATFPVTVYSTEASDPKWRLFEVIRDRMVDGPNLAMNNNYNTTTLSTALTQYGIFNITFGNYPGVHQVDASQSPPVEMQASFFPSFLPFHENAKHKTQN